MFDFHHVALSVRDIEASIAFYAVFGFKPVFRWQAEDGTLIIVHLKLGEALLELFCFAHAAAAPESSGQLATDLPRIGVKHFGIRVDDIDQASSYLQGAGMAEEIDVLHGRTGIRYFFVRDPSGILVEIVQDERNL